MLTLMLFWGQGILRPPPGFDTATLYEIECPILGQWQGLQRFPDPPRDQQIDIPVGCLERAVQASDGGRARRPKAGKLLRGDGAYHVRLTIDGQLFGEYSFAVKDGRIQLQGRQVREQTDPLDTSWITCTAGATRPGGSGAQGLRSELA
jgi:hypothetical protein